MRTIFIMWHLVTRVQVKKKKKRLQNLICNVFVYTAGTDSVFCSQMKAGTSREWRSTGVSMNHRFLQTWRGWEGTRWLSRKLWLFWGRFSVSRRNTGRCVDSSPKSPASNPIIHWKTVVEVGHLFICISCLDFFLKITIISFQANLTFVRS